MELNARAQVTTWTPFVRTPTFGADWPANHNINGYAQKTWAGLSRLSHAPRLRAFVTALGKQLRPGRPSIANLSDYVQDFIDAAVKFENEQWDPSELPAMETGSTVEIARRLQEKYKPQLPLKAAVEESPTLDQAQRLGCQSAPQSAMRFCNQSAPLAARVADLIGRLTLQEKVGQLSHGGALLGSRGRETCP